MPGQRISAAGKMVALAQSSSVDPLIKVQLMEHLNRLMSYKGEIKKVVAALLLK